ncbi:TPA: hypothetical protein EYO63_24765 [Candidatus Poribacteria bacterium]|nr:hypothetical protein [Candidatus Poribacteria bacterium]HIO79118.1 hypothetical protein [Candidatus Poribacteria bacterium]
MISLNMDKIEALDSANLKPDSFTLDQSARVTIKVYNVAGQLVEWMAQQQTRPRQTGRSLVGSR